MALLNEILPNILHLIVETNGLVNGFIPDCFSDMMMSVETVKSIIAA